MELGYIINHSTCYCLSCYRHEYIPLFTGLCFCDLSMCNECGRCAFCPICKPKNYMYM